MKLKYCPKCGEHSLRPYDTKSIICGSCGFMYYHNPAAVVIGIIRYENKIIVTTRANEPQKGLLALPGGFVDREESLEDALIRELNEELGITVSAPEYFCSHWERYLYREVVYFTTVAYFIVKLNNLSNVKINEEISDYALMEQSEIDYTKLAFEADRIALDRYRRLNLKGKIDIV